MNSYIAVRNVEAIQTAVSIAEDRGMGLRFFKMIDSPLLLMPEGKEDDIIDIFRHEQMTEFLWFSFSLEGKYVTDEITAEHASSLLHTRPKHRSVVDQFPQAIWPKNFTDVMKKGDLPFEFMHHREHSDVFIKNICLLYFFRQLYRSPDKEEIVDLHHIKFEWYDNDQDEGEGLW